MHRIIFGIVMLLGQWAQASMGPIPGEERFESLKEHQQGNQLGAELGFGAIDEDYFLTLNPRLDLNFGNFGLGFQVPLSLRVYDGKPKSSADYGGIIRKEDWDEVSDFMRVFRWLRLGHQRDMIYFRYGELAGELGHGTIMGRYMNNIDVDTFHGGIQFNLNTNYGGASLLVSDFVGMFLSKGAYTDSKILGVRGYIKPVALWDAQSLLNIFQLGVTVVGDFNAPWTLAQTSLKDVNGNDLLDANGNTVSEPSLDEKGNYVVQQQKAAVVWGFDLEAEILSNDLIEFIPYTDLNFMKNGGWGWHAGVQVKLKVPIGFEFAIPMRLEYRRFRSDYVPTYFSTFYEIERFYFPMATKGVPKNRFYSDQQKTKGLNGIYADLAFDFAGLVQVGAVYEDYTDSPGAIFSVFVGVPALEWVQFKAYYARTHIEDTQDIFKLDDRSFLVAQVRYEIVSYIYAVGRVTRRWEIEAGRPKAVTDWKVGIEASYSF